MSNDTSSVDEKIEKLSEEWGSVYTAYYPESFAYGPLAIVRNHTDEGIGKPRDDPPLKYEGETLTEALDEAIEEL